MAHTFGVKTLVVGLGAIAIASTALTGAAVAQKRGVGTVLGIGAGLLLMNEAAKAMQGKQQVPRKPRGEGGGEKSSASREKPGEGPQVSFSDVKRLTQVRNEINEIKRAKQQEDDRNVDLAVKGLLSHIEYKHQELRGQRVNVKVSTGTNINQVTAGEIKRTVEDAYKAGRLYEFERFAGELWTRDRLMVRLLRHAQGRLDPYFDGIGAKGPSMSDLSDLFDRSARDVYAKALEVAEIIGVSHSFERFIRTIYEYSDRADESLWTVGADGRYERLVTNYINSVPGDLFILTAGTHGGDNQGLEKQFQFRFRARRALYDCMASNYAELVGGSGKVIQASAKGDNTRGAKLERVQNAPSGGPVQTPTALETFEEIPGAWRRAETQMNSVCRTTLQRITLDATSGKIAPVPSRWDNAVGDSQGGRTENAVQPTRMQNPQ
ncbi:MAG: hypothetical protein HC868_13015 [Sphingomonadales bacterium]|nr:hypothetical protein [Sphingomonadales bacterium]